jgi:phosphoribosylamine--glycine ligase
VIFIGIMLTAKGPKVLEYNVRFGDPETQVIMPLFNGDWSETFKRVASGEAPKLSWHPNRHVACVVLAAEGYPDNPKRGVEISGLSNEQTENQDGYVLHAGTKKIDGKFVTAGGRVLNAVGVADSLAKALQYAYRVGQSVQWPGMQYRKDIGKSLV